jgi:hypothetical protein
VNCSAETMPHRDSTRMVAHAGALRCIRLLGVASGSVEPQSRLPARRGGEWSALLKPGSLLSCPFTRGSTNRPCCWITI